MLPKDNQKLKAEGQRPQRSIRKWLSAAFLLMGLMALPLGAVQHPVPLDPKTDGAKCMKCHADKMQGKYVHPAIAAGCLGCHEVRVNRDITRVKLITATPLGLCVSCHSDQKISDLKGKVHDPATRDCSQCHDPHSSDNKYQLVKATSGRTKDENLCLTCHAIGVDVPKGGSRHSAVRRGCETCHLIHKVGDPAKTEFAFHLTKGTPELCLDCHDAKDEDLAKAHQNQPFAKSDCTQCHDAHQSVAPELAQKFLHMPYAENKCEKCHEPAQDGKVVLTTPDVKSLCVKCHEKQAKEILTAKVRHRGAKGDCTDCHNPHAGSSRGFLQPNPVAACLNCHSDQAEEGLKAHLHQPAFQQGCATCHEPHGGENANLLRTGDINSLCLECHGPDANPQPVKGGDLMAIYNGKVQLPQDYLKKVPILPLKYGRGHPTENHPISTVVNLKDKTPAQMDCLSCHQPHASTKGGLLAKDQEPNTAFCKNCHTEGTLALR